MQQVEIRLDERVASADATVGPSERDEGGGICGAHDDELDRTERALALARIARAYDQVTPGVAQSARVDADGLERGDGVVLQRTLGHGDAQGRLLADRR